MPNRAEQPFQAKKKPPRRRRGIFEREAIAITIWLFGLPVVGLLIAIVLPQLIGWGIVPPLPGR
jgi:hypothetical protein